MIESLKRAWFSLEDRLFDLRHGIDTRHRAADRAADRKADREPDPKPDREAHRPPDRAPDRSGLPPDPTLADRLAEARRRADAHRGHGERRAPRPDRMER